MKLSINNRRHALAFGFTFVALALSISSARAVTVHFSEPSTWSVGDTGSSYQLWNSGGTSAQPVTTTLTHVANPGVTAPVLSQTGGFVAGSGGLYSFSGNYNVLAKVNNPAGSGDGTQVIFQSASTTNPDYDPEGDGSGGGVLRNSIKVLDSVGNLLASSTPVEVTRTYFDGNYPLFGGVPYEELSYGIFLPGYTGNFQVTFDMMIHSSLQALRIDSNITSVPEPSTALLLGLGLMAPLGARWVRRRKLKA